MDGERRQASPGPGCKGQPQQHDRREIVEEHEIGAYAEKTIVERTQGREALLEHRRREHSRSYA